MKHTIINLQSLHKPKMPLDMKMLRNFLHLECDDGDDELLQEFSIAAMEHLEQIMNRCIIKRQWKVVYGDFMTTKSSCRWVLLRELKALRLKVLGH